MNCKNCGDCCMQVESIHIFPMNYNKIKHKRPDIADYVTIIDGEVFLEMNYNPCPLFNQIDHKCSVYEIRPLTCRLYPLIPSKDWYSLYLIKKDFDKNNRLFPYEKFFGLDLTCKNFNTYTMLDYKKSLRVADEIILVQYQKIVKRLGFDFNNFVLNVDLNRKKKKITHYQEEARYLSIEYPKYTEIIKKNINVIELIREIMSFYNSKEYIKVKPIVYDVFDMILNNPQNLDQIRIEFNKLKLEV